MSEFTIPIQKYYGDLMVFAPVPPCTPLYLTMSEATADAKK